MSPMPQTPAAPRVTVPFNDHARVRFAACEPCRGEASIPADTELTNHFGSVHGGALFTVGEAAAGRAVLGLLPLLRTGLAEGAVTGAPPPEPFAVTRGAQIRYLRMARGAVTAQAQVQTPLAEIAAALGHQGRAAVAVPPGARGACRGAGAGFS